VKPINPALGRGIVNLAELAFLPVDGTDVDNAPEAAFAHTLNNVAGQVVVTGQIGVDNSMPLIRFYLVQWFVTGNAGVVNKNIYWPNIGFDLGNSGFASFEITDVKLESRDSGFLI
jgi:hypothetical protein